MLGEEYSKEKEAGAREYTKTLEDKKSPAADSFKEQNALYDQLGSEEKSKEINRESRRVALQELERQDARWQELTRRIEENRAQSERLKEEKAAHSVQSQQEFSHLTSDQLRKEMQDNAPEVAAARDRLYKDATDKAQDNFSMGNTHGAGADYAEQARSALSRDDQFQRRMESLQNGIDREGSPLDKKNLEAKRDLEFNEYKSAQLNKIAFMTGSKDAESRAVEHQEKANEAATNIKYTEILINQRDGLKSEKHADEQKDLDTLANQKTLEVGLTKKISLENDQQQNKAQTVDNHLERNQLQKEALNPDFVAMQKRLEASKVHQAEALKKIEEKRENQLSQTKSY